MDVLPPAQPEYILRGHQAQIHALSFYAGNSRLLSADADGYIISWDMVSKRPVAGWRAHQKAVLGIAAWNEETIISHGRDSRLVVWRLDRDTEQLMHQYIPADQPEDNTARPAILQEMTVNTMNFCAFAWCEAPFDMAFADLSLGSDSNVKTRKPILLAVPNTIDSDAIDIFYMPAATRKSTIVSPKDEKTGMAMAILISAKTSLMAAAGYESGDVIVYQHNVKEDAWKVVYKARPHSQPVLSLCLHPLLRVCISSSADGIIAKHPFADADLLDSADGKPVKLQQTKHSGQQGLAMRNDGRIYSTAGWDSRIRIYSAKSMKELAVLKHHKQGCYETALADVEVTELTSVASLQQPVGTAHVPAGNSSDTLVPKSPPKGQAMTKYAQKVMQTHWLAAGSKDGNISLWNVF